MCSTCGGRGRAGSEGRAEGLQHVPSLCGRLVLLLLLSGQIFISEELDMPTSFYCVNLGKPGKKKKKKK